MTVSELSTNGGEPDSGGLEPLDDFRDRARAFLVRSMPHHADVTGPVGIGEAQQLQRILYEAGFAGIAFPAKYGGAGLTLAHQEIFAEEAATYRMPYPLCVSIATLGATLLDRGSEELKQAHLPKILAGDEIWLQLLSEPSGGSDMAGATTRADQSDDKRSWIINGMKTWTTGADIAHYGMCLARTNFDVPKHDGLSMFAVPLREPGVRIEPIHSAAGGPVHFFQETFDDVVIPAGNLVGGLNNGWAVAHTLLYHERNAAAGVSHGRGYTSAPGSQRATGSGMGDLINLSRAAGTVGDPIARQSLAEAHVAAVVASQLSDRVMRGLRLGAFKGDWGSLLKLGMGIDAPRRGEIALAVGGAAGVVWPAAKGDNVDAPAVQWLAARRIALAGGTNEMQRNIVSERLLGMPRETPVDRDLPFRALLDRQSRGGVGDHPG